MRRVSKQDGPVQHKLTHIYFPAGNGDLGRRVEAVRVRQEGDGGVPRVTGDGSGGGPTPPASALGADVHLGAPRPRARPWPRLTGPSWDGLFGTDLHPNQGVS